MTVNKYSQTLYKDNLYKQIRETLGCSKAFIKANKIRRSLVQEKLSELCLLANHTSIFNINTMKHENMINEYESFNHIFNRSINKKYKRVDSSDMSRQIEIVISDIYEYLRSSGYITDSIDVIKVKSSIISEEICNICLLSSVPLIKYDHTLKGIESNHNEFLSVNFINNLSKNLLIHLSSIIVQNHIQTSTIIKHILDHSSIIIAKSRAITNISYQISEIFESCVLDDSRVYHCRATGKSYKLMSIPEYILSSYILPTHMPRIVEPDSTHDNNKDYSIYSKSISEGISSIDISSETRNALIISQKKKFRINNEAIKLFNIIDELPYEIVKNIKCLPFTPIKHLEYLDNIIINMKYNINDDISKQISYELYNIMKSDIKVNNIVDELSIKLNIDNDIIDYHLKYYNYKKEYNDKLRLRKLHNTTIKFAELFIDFTIYFTSCYDYRLRMYPYSYFFSRTTGIYKYLVSEFEYTRVSPEGYITMVKAYINNFEEKYTYLGEISVNNIKNIKDNFKPLDISDIINESSYFYYYLLGNEIYKLRNTDKTNFMIEIDQKSSSTVFMSIILGDKKLASQCNLISNSVNDPPKILMSKFESFYKYKVSNDTLKEFTTNRKVHKYLLMCFCYNQTHYGRTELIKEYISNYKDVSYISSTYPSFIDTVFDNLSIKKDKLNNIIRYYTINSNESIKIDTIDGSKISWFIFKKRDNKFDKNKYKSVLVDIYISYSNKRYEEEKSDVHKTVVGLIPSFIHSLDAAIMRKIINKVYIDNKYIINHLHDSIQLHPNQYNKVLDSISYVYLNSNLDKCLDNCLLKNLSNNLIVEKREIFEKLIDEFKSSNYEELVLTKEKFNVRGMFPFE
jgi:hypothetical protein